MNCIRLPIGVEKFSEIRKDNCYYMDKTGLIEELNRIKETQIALREHISHAIKGIEQLEEIKK